MATMDNLSSLDHFDFWFDEEENAYRFNTETGVQYYITLPEYFIMDLNVYMLNIDRYVPKGTKKANSSLLIRNTVLIILSNFFKNKENALIAICETKDTLEHARHRLFERWFKTAITKLGVNWIRREDAPFTLSDGCVNYAMLYYHKDNNMILPLKTQFSELIYNKFFME